MYFRATMLRRIVRNYFRPEYERLKRDCKEHIMLTGKPYKLVILMDSPTLVPPSDDKLGAHMLGLDFKLQIVEGDFSVDDEKDHVIYEPDLQQVQQWAESPEARKIKIKTLLS